MGNSVHGPRIALECVPMDLWSLFDGDGYDAMLVVARKDGLRLDAYDANRFSSAMAGWDEVACEDFAEKGEDVAAMCERRSASNRHLKEIMRANPGWPTEALPGAARDDGSAGQPTADWTTGPEGRENTSQRFEGLVAEVERIIRDSGFDLINGRAGTVAGLIMAQLAHVHGLVPRERGTSADPHAEETL